jgi:hypothetical protein
MNEVTLENVSEQYVTSYFRDYHVNEALEGR